MKEHREFSQLRPAPFGDAVHSELRSHRLIAAESQRFDDDTVAHPCRFFGFFFFWAIAEGVLEHARGKSIIQKTEKFLLF